MILRGIKRVALLALMGTTLAGCLAELPGGETGPFAPGNEITFYYQTVLTDPPEVARIIECDGGFAGIVKQSCIRLANNATFPLEVTETGVAYGNDQIRVALSLDPTGVPSGVGQLNDLASGESRGMRWVSLPR